ncbi:MAG: phosphoribosyl-ATP diphosphatase [Spirochaetota bacterium]
MSFLFELESLLQARKSDLPENSYTASLFQGGLDRILKKIGEEAGEVIIAAKNNNSSEFIHEVADLLFHMQVLLVEKEVPLTAITQELEKRHKK